MGRLAKLAAVSRKLHRGIAKEAFVSTALRLGGKAATLGLKAIDKFPKASLATAATVGLGGAAGVGSYRQHRLGFDPRVQKAMLGEPPTPPGVS